MDYSFVRRLTSNIEVNTCKRIFNYLSENGIEVFIKNGHEYTNWSSDACEYAEECDLYVSAADLEFARGLVTGIGLEKVLCTEKEISKGVEKSPVEKAEEEFYRKHKQNQVFAWAVIAGVIIYMFFHFLK